jgi:monolysocardiolipin acyltransferase
MPEGRSFPYKYIPRLGASLRISIGSPLPPEDFSVITPCEPYTSYKDLTRRDLGGWLSERRIRESIRKDGDVELQLQNIRSEVTAVMHRAVETLGRKVAGDLLGGEKCD